MSDLPAEAEHCTSIEASDGLRCDGEAVIAVLVGCVHEHVGIRSACRFHVEGLAHGRQDCRPCFDADGHACEMHLLREVARA